MTGSRVDDVVLAVNIAGVRARIDGACKRAGRDPGGVTLLAVSKGHGPAAIAAAREAGVRDFGENRVQEAQAKVQAFSRGGQLRWHLVGHLQRNKVKAALSLFDILHSVDSFRLAEAVSQHASHTVTVLLEVNIGGETSKHGVMPEAAFALAERIAGLERVDLAGLMTVAPRADNADDVRPVFRRLRELRDAIGLRELSMGMTDDFEVAVEEGATIVRVGRAIFAGSSAQA
jgi:pyridoxal phosphate enzyme (YggS family)